MWCIHHIPQWTKWAKNRANCISLCHFKSINIYYTSLEASWQDKSNDTNIKGCLHHKGLFTRFCPLGTKKIKFMQILMNWCKTYIKYCIFLNFGWNRSKISWVMDHLWRILTFLWWTFKQSSETNFLVL